MQDKPITLDDLPAETQAAFCASDYADLFNFGFETVEEAIAAFLNDHCALCGVTGKYYPIEMMEYDPEYEIWIRVGEQYEPEEWETFDMAADDRLSWEIEVGMR